MIADMTGMNAGHATNLLCPPAYASLQGKFYCSSLRSASRKQAWKPALHLQTSNSSWQRLALAQYLAA
jgi:hypothetical protein